MSETRQSQFFFILMKNTTFRRLPADVGFLAACFTIFKVLTLDQSSIEMVHSLKHLYLINTNPHGLFWSRISRGQDPHFGF